MKHCWLKSGHRRLLVVALGWGQTCEHWRAKDFGNRDVLILGEWNALGDLPELSGYDGYDLLAWSFGVWAAAQLDFKVIFDHATAVNGTLFPIDDRRGIPEQIFRLTVEGWRPGKSGRSFWRRMGSEQEPERDDDSLLQELRFFQDWFARGRKNSRVDYDRVMVGRCDRIFPAAHQREAWAGKSLYELDLPHDMEGALDQVLRLATGTSELDKALIATRFKRSADTYDEHAVVQREMAERLAQALPHRRFDRALEFGCGTGVFTRMLKPRCGRLFRNDLVPGPGEDFLCGDIETLELPQDLDLIAGNAVWQWLTDPHRMVRRCHEALREGGVLAVSAFAPGTMVELAELLGVSLDYCPTETFRTMFEPGFRLVAHEEYQRILRFDSPLDVLKHLKHTGVTAAGGQFHWTKGRLADFDRQYRSRFPDITLTYRPILLVAERSDRES